MGQNLLKSWDFSPICFQRKQDDQNAKVQYIYIEKEGIPMYRILKRNSGSFIVQGLYDDEKFEIETKLDFEEGDVIYYSEKDDEYLLVSELPVLIANIKMKDLDNNGRIPYDELSDKEKTEYDEAQNKIISYWENPILMDYDRTIKFLALRKVLELKGA